jgi:type IV pilus assembly protein PilB
MNQSDPQNLKLGEILIKEGYLTTDALNKLLDMQKEQHYISSARKAYRPLGQMCVELKLITPDELQKVLRKHNKSILLGELLVNLSLIRPAQLEQALKTQKSALGLKLGEVLVEQGVISEAQLVDSLSLQLDVPRIFPSLDLVDRTLLDSFDERYLEEEECLPVHREGKTLTVLMVDPLNQRAIEYLEKISQCQIKPAIAPPSRLREVIQEYLEERRQARLQPLQPLAAAAPPAAESSLKVGGVSVYTNTEQMRQEEKVVQFLLKNAMKDRASDIHIEPQERGLRIRYRIDGVLHHKTDLPSELTAPMISRLKQLCGLDDKRRTPQRNRMQATILDRQLELSMATYPSQWGETVTLGIKEQQGAAHELLFNLERTGFSPLYLRRYQQQLEQPGGLLIVTGPARSGKTTSLYASIRYLNEQNRSIITAENPIEHLIPGTVQGQWDPGYGTFADHIRAMGYLDSDMMMVGEIDSPATLEASLELALSGAKVLTAYPAFDATGALLRLAGMGLESYLIASSHVTVLSQRLVRRLCPHCKVAIAPPPAAFFFSLGLVGIDPDGLQFWGPKGCEHCQQHGYQGMMAIHELLVINEAIREAILERKPAATIRGIARTEAKLVSMAEDGIYKALEGLTSPQEIQRVAFVNEYDSQTPWDAAEIQAICSGQEAEFF